jgi:hypothetical protein
MQPHRQVPSRRAAAPGQTAVRRHCRSRGPGLRGGPGSRGKRPLPGKRRTCRVCYTPPASAATASGDVAAGRRGRIAGMTTVMLPADLAAVSSLPLAGQRAAPGRRLCVAGRWRVRRSRAARNSRYWCLSFAGLLLPRSHCLRCSGRRADSCPRQGEILSLAVSCCWRQSQRAGRRSRAPVSEPARSGEPGPGSRRPQRAAGQRGRCQRGQPASEPFMLVEPQLVQTRGYRSQVLPFSSACLINGRVVTCSCWSRSAVLI